jgi:hypothetical protein
MLTTDALRKLPLANKRVGKNFIESDLFYENSTGS